MVVTLPVYLSLLRFKKDGVTILHFLFSTSQVLESSFCRWKFLLSVFPSVLHLSPTVRPPWVSLVPLPRCLRSVKDRRGKGVMSLLSHPTLWAHTPRILPGLRKKYSKRVKVAGLTERKGVGVLLREVLQIYVLSRVSERRDSIVSVSFSLFLRTKGKTSTTSFILYEIKTGTKHSYLFLNDTQERPSKDKYKNRFV